MSSKKTHQLIEEELKDINLPRYQRRRLLAIKLHLEGFETGKITSKLGVSIRTVQRYIKDFNENKNNFLIHRKKPGNTPKISEIQMAALRNDISTNPLDFGHMVEYWTAGMLTAHIQAQYGILLGEESCRKILKEVYTKRKTVKSNKKEIQGLMSNGADIWAVEEIYLGPYRIKRKKINDKKVWIPESLLTFREFKQAKVEKQKKMKKIMLLCAQNLVTKELVYRITTHTDSRTELECFYRSLPEQGDSNDVVLLVAKSAHNRKLATRIIGKRAKKRIKILFFPPLKRDLRPLLKLKDQLIQKFSLLEKDGSRKEIDSDTINYIDDYLRELMQP